VQPIRPSFKLTDTTGTTTIDFQADSVTLNDMGFTVINQAFVTNVSIAQDMLFEKDTAFNKHVLKQGVISSIQDAINKGYITCDGNTSFNVEIDTSATSNSVYNPLTQQNVYRFAFNPQYQNLSPAEQRKLSAKWAAERKRIEFIQNIRDKNAPAIINHHGNKPRALINWGAKFDDAKPNELVALQLLKSMVSRDVFKKYLKHGFITVDGPSGLTYQVQRKSHNVRVWKKGMVVSTLCIYVKDQHIPPTDDVVAKMLMCLYSEKDIWNGANITWKAPANIIIEVVNTLGIPLPTERKDFAVNIYAPANHIEVNAVIAA
jgi:hypothetical protein